LDEALGSRASGIVVDRDIKASKSHRQNYPTKLTSADSNSLSAVSGAVRASAAEPLGVGWHQGVIPCFEGLENEQNRPINPLLGMKCWRAGQDETANTCD
jgi:hypothetical protein